MGVELIRDEDPLIVGCSGDGLCDMSHKVQFGAGRANARGNLFSGRHLEIGRQTLRPMANVFVFLTFAAACLACHTGLHGFAGRSAFKRLNAGLFIGAHQMNILRVQLRSLLVKVAYRFDLYAKFFCVSAWCVKPVFNPIRF